MAKNTFSRAMAPATQFCQQGESRFPAGLSGGEKEMAFGKSSGYYARLDEFANPAGKHRAWLHFFLQEDQL